MPVELSHFTAHSTPPTTHLTWSTATETNNSHFEVQRSADARKWEVLGEVKGAGTTQEPQKYAYTDREPLPGLAYYRLRQVDYDGQYEYSPIVTVSHKGGKFELSVFPNPASEFLYLSLPPGEEEYTAELCDARGQRLARQPLAPGGGRVEVPLSGLPPGFYYLAVLDSRGRQVGVERFVKASPR